VYCYRYYTVRAAERSVDLASISYVDCLDSNSLKGLGNNLHSEHQTSPQGFTWCYMFRSGTDPISPLILLLGCCCCIVVVGATLFKNTLVSLLVVSNGIAMKFVRIVLQINRPTDMASYFQDGGHQGPPPAARCCCICSSVRRLPASPPIA